MKIYKALSEFQNEVPVIHKGTQGYGYSYADLPAIFEVINPLLKKYNLGFTQPIMGDTIKTIIFHTESGETIESLTEIPKGVTLKGMNDYQVLGSAKTQQECNKELMRLNTIHRHGTGYCFRESIKNGNSK